MSRVTFDAEARQELLDTVARAIDQIAVALAALGDAFETLDERAADVLEAQLFRPVQSAYGRGKRTHADFATRNRMRQRRFDPRAARVGTTFESLERATDAIGDADGILADLQDSLLPVEVGDAELRAGLADVRRQLTEAQQRATQFVRVIGR
jgi:hypothetical protein